jgi:TonB family protein
VSDGETSASPLTLPADLLTRQFESRERQALPWLGIIAAALLHLATLASFIVNWSLPHTLPREPDVIPVKVVFEPPPPPPPAVPVPKPPQPPPPAYAESGPDQRTTAPPPAETPAPEVASPPPPAPEAEKTEDTPPAPPSEKPAPPEHAKPKPQKEVARLEPPKKEAETPRAPRPATAPMRLNIQPGERVEHGDPYLNRLWDLIEHHRIYPRVLGNFGLPAEGTAVYAVVIDRSGKVLAMQLEHSSGVAGIDRAVEEMIRNSLPFPPVPTTYPDPIEVDVSIRLFPPS